MTITPPEETFFSLYHIRSGSTSRSDYWSSGSFCCNPHFLSLQQFWLLSGTMSQIVVFCLFTFLLLILFSEKHPNRATQETIWLQLWARRYAGFSPSGQLHWRKSMFQRGSSVHQQCSVIVTVLLLQVLDSCPCLAKTALTALIVTSADVCLSLAISICLEKKSTMRMYCFFDHSNRSIIDLLPGMFRNRVWH